MFFLDCLDTGKHGYILFVHRDAEDAVYRRNGYDYGQCRLRVEFPKPSRGRGGGFGGGPRGRNGPPSRRSEFRVLVSGMFPSKLHIDWNPSDTISNCNGEKIILLVPYYMVSFLIRNLSLWRSFLELQKDTILF